MSGVPVDLSKPAVRAARRLQALPKGRVYAITLLKLDDMWVLSVQNPQGSKAELLQSGRGCDIIK